MFNPLKSKFMKTKDDKDTIFKKNGIKKMLLTMKITLFLFILTVFQAAAESVFSQSQPDQPEYEKRYGP